MVEDSFPLATNCYKKTWSSSWKQSCSQFLDVFTVYNKKDLLQITIYCMYFSVSQFIQQYFFEVCPQDWWHFILLENTLLSWEVTQVCIYHVVGCRRRGSAWSTGGSGGWNLYRWSAAKNHLFYLNMHTNTHSHILYINRWTWFIFISRLFSVEFCLLDTQQYFRLNWFRLFLSTFTDQYNTRSEICQSGYATVFELCSWSI